MVAESGEEEQGIGSETTRFEINKKRFVFVCDQDIVGAKISVGKPEVMELTNDFMDAKKELFVDRLMTPQGWPVNHLHRKATAVEIDEFRGVRKSHISQSR